MSESMTKDSPANHSENLLKFLQLASKTGDMQYYTQSEIQFLKSMGQTLGLPTETVESIIRTKAVHNAAVLKELSDKVKDLRDTKELLHFVQVKLNQNQGINQSQSIIVKQAGLGHHQHDESVHLAAASESNPNHQFMASNYQASIQKLELETHELHFATGGEGDNRKAKDIRKGDLKHEKITTDKTRLPLKPINKKFEFER